MQLKIYGVTEGGLRLLDSFNWQQYGSGLCCEERNDSTYFERRYDVTIVGNFKLLQTNNDQRLRISPAGCELGYAAFDRSMFYYAEVLV